MVQKGRPSVSNYYDIDHFKPQATFVVYFSVSPLYIEYFVPPAPLCPVSSLQNPFCISPKLNKTMKNKFSLKC